MNWSEFFQMGGYAFYVWTAWGLSLIVITYLFTMTKVRGAKIRREILRQIEREKLHDKSSSNGNLKASRTR